MRVRVAILEIRYHLLEREHELVEVLRLLRLLFLLFNGRLGFHDSHVGVALGLMEHLEIMRPMCHCELVFISSRDMTIVVFASAQLILRALSVAHCLLQVRLTLKDSWIVLDDRLFF